MARVLLVCIDALRADHLGCAGHPGARTPEIDALAGQGVFFRQAVTQAPWTRPAVASLFTSRYPSQHGLLSLTKGGGAVTTLDPSLPTLAELFAAGRHRTAAFAGQNANLRPVFGLARGFGDFQVLPSTDGAAVVDQFARWLERLGEEPFFCYLHFMDVHDPLPTAVVSSRLERGLDLHLVDQGIDALRGHYAAAVGRVDGHVGRVLRLLREAGRFEDCWVVVTADHGEELLDHGAMLAHGRTLYDELLRVPLVIKLPGQRHAGRVVEEPVELIDLMPTLLEGAELFVPPDVQGRSLLPLLEGSDGWRPRALAELLKRDRYAQALRTRQHKYIRTFQLERVRPITPPDLRPGVFVRSKGETVGGGQVLATHVSVKREPEREKLRGRIEQVDAARRQLTVLGLPLVFGESAAITGLQGEPLAFADLRPGDTVTVTFDPASGGRRATALRRKKAGGKVKVRGPIEQAEERPQGLRRLTVLGVTVLVGAQTALGASRETTGARDDQAPGAHLVRVLAGDFLELRRELYDLAEDADEAHNLVDAQPQVAEELDQALTAWTRAVLPSARSAAGHTVEADEETLAQLRRMGYID